MYFSVFTNYFFYFYVIYNYLKYKFPEQTQDVLIVISYNFVYLYSKLQIILNKNKNYTDLYNKFQVIYNNFNKARNSSSSNPNRKITLDFVFDNEIKITFEKQEFLDNFYFNETVKARDVIDYDFVIVNGTNNLKKIITKNTFETFEKFETIFEIEPLTYEPMLCEVITKEKVVEINLRDDSKFYNFLVLDNSLDSEFFIYFMKKYYEIALTEDYVIKILDHMVNANLFEISEILKFEKNNIIKY